MNNCMIFLYICQELTINIFMNKSLKIVIVGGGSAGWLTAGWLSVFHKDCEIEVIESPTIPTIGVGESVTPHVDLFLSELGIDRHHWMKTTNSVYKLANKFTNWVTNSGETEYFSFNYTLLGESLYQDVSKFCFKDQLSDRTFLRTTDVLYSLIKNKKLDKFDKYFNPQYSYMENNTCHIKGDINCLNQLGSFSQHINAEQLGTYIKDYIAVPNGVKSTIATINKVTKASSKISHLVTDNGDLIDGDLFIDCSGFKRVLMNAFPLELHRYKDNPINSSVVAQTDYADPKQELVNYTQSIARDNGWQFKIGLYNRMGNGYCFSDAHETQAFEKFESFVSNIKNEPRLISWTPERLVSPGIENAAAIGLSAGFVEPLEANALYTIITGIKLVGSVIDNYKETNNFDWSNYNTVLTHTLDDIADFLIVHYTLSQRQDTDFWNDMRAIGKENHHEQLIKDKYNDIRNTMMYATTNYTMFPDYMWLQLASHYGIDLDINVRDDILELGLLEFKHTYKKHQLISKSNLNNYEWLERVIFGSSGSKY